MIGIIFVKWHVVRPLCTYVLAGIPGDHPLHRKVAYPCDSARDV
jgi:hypothetical protein